MNAAHQPSAAFAFATDSESVRKAQLALAASPFAAVRRLRVTQAGEYIHLSGQLPSFYLKQVAQELVKAAVRPCGVLNEIEVP